jgi:hypothetical protein
MVNWCLEGLESEVGIAGEGWGRLAEKPLVLRRKELP